MILPTFPKFNVHEEEHSVGVRWEKYLHKLENLFVGLNIEAKKRRKALLLHFAGDAVFDIYETVGLGGDDSNYDETKEALTQYLNPKKNTEFERYGFRQMKQWKSESADQFATRLRQKAATCEFTDKDAEIKSQIIQGCYSDKLRRKCLEEEKNLSDMMKMARSMEIASRQAKTMTNGDYEDVHAVQNRNAGTRQKVFTQPSRKQQTF